MPPPKSPTYLPISEQSKKQTVYAVNEASNIEQFFKYLDSLESSNESSNELCNRIINISKHRDDILNLVFSEISQFSYKSTITQMNELLVEWEKGKLNTILTPLELKKLFISVLNDDLSKVLAKIPFTPYPRLIVGSQPSRSKNPPNPRTPTGELRVRGNSNSLTSIKLGGGGLTDIMYVQTLVYKHLVQTTISNLLKGGSTDKSLDLQCLNTIKKFMEEIFGKVVVLDRKPDPKPHPFLKLGGPLEETAAAVSRETAAGKKRSQKKKKQKSKGKRRKSSRRKNKKKRN